MSLCCWNCRDDENEVIWRSETKPEEKQTLETHVRYYSCLNHFFSIPWLHMLHLDVTLSDGNFHQYHLWSPHSILWNQSELQLQRLLVVGQIGERLYPLHCKRNRQDIYIVTEKRRFSGMQENGSAKWRFKTKNLNILNQNVLITTINEITI